MLPLLYHAHHNRHLEDLPFWLELASRTGDPVLELGCGTGRVLIPLAQAGHCMVGVDRDPTMLHFLRGIIGLQLKPSPLLLLADISKFNLAEQFPLIILPCNTFSTLPEKKRLGCLKCVCDHLKPGGLFVFSIPNPELIKELPARSEAEVEDEFNHPKTGDPLQVSSAWRKTKRTFNLTWIYDHLLPDGRVERHIVETAHQIIPADTYMDEIRRAGMKIVDIYGDYDHSAYYRDSPYLICLASI